jgi:hypothetical protein
LQARMAPSEWATKAVNLLTGKANCVGHGFHDFANDRLGRLLQCGVT